MSNWRSAYMPVKSRAAAERDKVAYAAEAARRGAQLADLKMEEQLAGERHRNVANA